MTREEAIQVLNMVEAHGNIVIQAKEMAIKALKQELKKARDDMRLIDADELLEHAYRDKLDSRDLIVNMIKSAPTVKEIPINIPLSLIVKAIEQEPKKGEWLRMSDLSEQEDDRYKCSHCGNVIHHKNKKNLYTFNSWCGRCGSDNGTHINYKIESKMESE